MLPASAIVGEKRQINAADKLDAENCLGVMVVVVGLTRKGENVEAAYCGQHCMLRADGNAGFAVSGSVWFRTSSESEIPSPSVSHLKGSVWETSFSYASVSPSWSES